MHPTKVCLKEYPPLAINSVEYNRMGLLSKLKQIDHRKRLYNLHLQALEENKLFDAQKHFRQRLGNIELNDIVYYLGEIWEVIAICDGYIISMEDSCGILSHTEYPYIKIRGKYDTCIIRANSLKNIQKT